MKRLNTILLIDDDSAINFYHKRVIKSCDVAEEVIAIESGEEALDYLKTRDKGNNPKPDLILLDINMPGMDGWEFLDHYGKLDESQKANKVVVMLTTSLNPDDKAKAKNFDPVSGFKNKPLTKEMLMTIVNEFFETGQ